MRSHLFRVLALCSLCLAWACGPPATAGGSIHGPYDEGGVVGIDKDGARAVSPNDTCAANDPACIKGSDVGTLCKGAKGPADVLVKDGKVIAEICYPPTTGEGGKREIGPDDLTGVKTNGARVTFKPSGDGTPHKGDLPVEGNGNIVYGNGADKTLIEGNATFKGNNNRLRGVTVKKDVSFEGNNASMVLSQVGGNLLVKGNNAILADIVVWGDLTVEGNNHILMRIFVAGKVVIKGDNYQCIETYHFEDKDKDEAFDPDKETGDAFRCGKK